MSVVIYQDMGKTGAGDDSESFDENSCYHSLSALKIMLNKCLQVFFSTAGTVTMSDNDKASFKCRGPVVVADRNRTKPLLMLLVTPALFLPQ